MSAYSKAQSYNLHIKTFCFNYFHYNIVDMLQNLNATMDDVVLGLHIFICDNLWGVLYRHKFQYFFHFSLANSFCCDNYVIVGTPALPSHKLFR